MNIRMILAIMRKDVVDAVKNQFIFAFLAVPVVIALIFKVILPGSTDSQKLTVVTYDPDRSRLVVALQKMPDIQVLEVNAGDQITESMKVNQAVGGLAIPPGFDVSLEAGKQPELTAYLNYRQNDVKRRAFQSLIKQQIAALMPPPASVAWVNVDASLESQARSPFVVENFILIVILVLPVVGTGMMIIPLLLVEEKEKHTLSFLLVSPASTTDIVLGKALTGFMFNLAITGIVVGFNHGWKGNWGITFLALFLGSLFTVPVGLVLGSFFRNAIQLNTWGTIPMVLLLLPSWTYIGQALSPALRTIVGLIPTYYLVDTLNLSLRGEASIARVWGNLAALSASTIIAFAVAVYALRRERKE